MINKKTLYKILNIISSIILIIAYAFIIVQSVINIIYSNNNTNHIIAERIIYEQFSHEVYSNIKTKAITEIKKSDPDSNCPQDYEIMSLPIKYESFYDCEGVDNDEIDEDICQNKITSSSLCCEKKCCTINFSGKKETKVCRNKNINIYYNEPREKLCTIFSKYNGRFYLQNKKLICVKRDRAYEELLLYNEENQNCHYYCRYLDSKGHCLCSPVTSYETNGNKVIVKNILSVTKPSYFEIETYLKLSMMLNKKNYDEKKIKKEVEKISKMSSKTIYETFKGEKCIHNCFNDNYEYKEEGKINDIISKEYIFNDIRSNDYIKNQYFIWYTRNYIGFQNSTELKKFKTYFDYNNHKNNSLYKISKTLYPYYPSCIIGLIICIITIIYIVILFNDLKTGEIDYIYKNINLNNIKTILVFILFLIYLLIYLIGYYFQFDAIYIDMEEFYQKVLEKYNYRRKQIYLVIGVIIFSFNFFIELIIQNLKCSITHGSNFIVVKIKLREIECNEEHKVNLNINQEFSSQIQKIQNVLKRCNICKEDTDIIENYYFKDKKIEISNKVGLIGLEIDSSIEID